MTENSPELSIIVPVYKVESYLRKCVDSIQIVSHTDLEISLDDDSLGRFGKISCAKNRHAYTAVNSRVQKVAFAS